MTAGIADKVARTVSLSSRRRTFPSLRGVVPVVSRSFRTPSHVIPHLMRDLTGPLRTPSHRHRVAELFRHCAAQSPSSHGHPARPLTSSRTPSHVIPHAVSQSSRTPSHVIPHLMRDLAVPLHTKSKFSAF